MTRIARVVASVAALSLALVGMLPVAHLHAADHHQVVHQHAIADGPAPHHHPDDDHDGGVGQSDHTAARILTLAFDLTPPVAVIGSAGAAVLLLEPAVTRASLAVRAPLLPTHDPPLRFVSSPAPPAVVSRPRTYL